MMNAFEQAQAESKLLGLKILTEVKPDGKEVYRLVHISSGLSVFTTSSYVGLLGAVIGFKTGTAIARAEGDRA